MRGQHAGQKTAGLVYVLKDRQARANQTEGQELNGRMT